MASEPGIQGRHGKWLLDSGLDVISASRAYDAAPE
jgi:hypothetical protein